METTAKATRDKQARFHKNKTREGMNVLLPKKKAEKNLMEFHKKQNFKILNIPRTTGKKGNYNRVLFSLEWNGRLP